MRQFRTLFACTMLIAATSVQAARAWEPAAGPLKTRWTKDVTPEKALPEYPRPQMVRDKWMNLNGLWQYAIRPKGEPRPEKWDGEILVPFCIESALSGVKKPVKPDERLWYRRTFSSAALAGQKRMLLHFGAVDWECTAWVNGKEVGHHTGGYVPFTFDITNALKSGRARNELVVAVSDPTDTGEQPRGKQVLNPHGIFYTAVTGIWQTVWLEPVPKDWDCIESFTVVPDIDHKLVKLHANVPRKGRVRFVALDGRKEVASVEGVVGKEIDLPIPHPELWSPDQPHLYGLRIELFDAHNDNIVDTVTGYFGMRKIEVKKDADGINRIWLNNQVVFQYGPLDQGWWPDGLYTAPTEAALKYDIEMTKRLGFNMIRKHVKVEPARWYHLCDKLGVLVWQDMPSGDVQKSEQGKEDYSDELRAMIESLQNAPCIVVWVPFNEGWGQHDTENVVKTVKALDPSRLVDEASGWNDKGSGDLSDMHNYPGPGMRDLDDKRACVLGEFGGLGMPVKGHTWQSEKNWGYVSYGNAEELTDAYVNLLTMMRPLIGQGLSAAVYTQTTDVEVEVNGLMTYDRERAKMDEAKMTAAAKKLFSTPPKATVLAVTSENHPETWHYLFSKPRGEWMQPDFDDRDWRTGPGGFGTIETPRAVARSGWDTDDIWLRRKFDVSAVPANGRLMLIAHHDEGAEVYLNGTLIENLKGATRHYGPSMLGDSARKLLRAGENVLAVHCHQTTGGQYIDVGLTDVVDR